MAALQGKNVVFAATGKKSAPGMQNGHVKHHQDEILFAAEVAAADTISLGKIPKGSKVQSVKIQNSAALGAGTFKVGYAPTASDASDRTADIAIATVFSAAGTTVVSLCGDALLEEKEVILTCTVATTTATGKTLRGVVNFVAD